MRVRIDGPCFIESEQPFTITPIYVSKADRAEDIDPYAYTYHCTAEGCERRFNTALNRFAHYQHAHPDLITPDEKNHAKPKRRKGTPRKGSRYKGHKHTCRFCERGYIRRSSRSHFCSDSHRHAWMRENGFTDPLTPEQKVEMTKRLGE